MKVVGLDLGDRWVGVAISDGLAMTCRPYETVELTMLEEFLVTLFSKEVIETVIVGYPKTMQGLESEQTLKVSAYKERLAQIFPSYTWILWDERLSSKRAQNLEQYKGGNKGLKHKEHALAAAFILQGYLDARAFATFHE